MSSLTRNALAGAAWNYAGAAVLVVVQIASTATTARLVSPKEFGAYATAQAAAGIFGYFTLGAVAQDILRRPELGSKTVGTAVSISLACATAVAVTTFLVAGAWSSAWHVPSAEPLVRVFALSLLLLSYAIVPLALLRRRLRFRTAAILETGSQVIGITAGILLALQMHSAMALAIGQAIAAGILIVGAVALTRGELALGFDGEEVRKLSSFAGRVTATNLAFFSLYTAPSLLVARMFGAQTLGLYSRANVIVTLPLNYLTTGLMKVMYPLYGRIGTEIARTRALLTEALSVATGIVWPLFALLAGASPIVVRLLLGHRWAGAAVLVELCVLIACGNLPWALLTNASEAFGWMRLVWARQAIYLGVLVAGVALVHFAGVGVVELLIAVAAAQWIAYGLTVLAFVRRDLLEPRLTINSHWIHAAVALVAFAGAAACEHVVRGRPIGLQVVAELAVALGVGAAVIGGRFRFPARLVLAERLSHVGMGSHSRLLIRMGFTTSR